MPDKIATLKVTSIETIKMPVQYASYIAALIQDAESPYTNSGFCLSDVGETEQSYTAEVIEA